MAGGGELDVQNDYDFQIGTQRARTSATANLAYRLTDGNKLIFRNFYTHDSDDEARTFQGLNRDVGEEIRNFRLRLTATMIVSVDGAATVSSVAILTPPTNQETAQVTIEVFDRFGQPVGSGVIEGCQPGERIAQNLAELVPALAGRQDFLGTASIRCVSA